ncbi:hypothetical protein B0A54_17914 [Friedmanniomyces endolithicus]|uniref:Xaa-Pro dipeptidyl-peptidase C-terminal domain-containing protein n=1 Tax=Friedmanniomyces endolithicus TaxID=329885 RepID=A0A4U0TPL8_9PEZI|nr:hypothetical protein B0A54_17914 [Friedmanniomyces endolithicus]
MEWHDLYQPSTNDELQLFFDRYTKGIDNGLEEKLPRVRENIVNYPLRTWPPPDTVCQRLYLAQDQRLIAEAPPEHAFVEYPADRVSQQIDDDDDEALFRFTFKKRSFLHGSVKAVLAMSCADHDDMDVFLSVRKMDFSGKVLRYANVPSDEMSANGVDPDKVPLLNLCYYLGPHGQIRASHRAIDEELSKPHYIQHKHLQEEKIPPGTVVEVATSVWPGGIVFNEGESLVFKVSGHPMTLAEFSTLRGCFVTRNKGRNQIHCGGEKGSYIDVPFVEM